MLLEYRTTHYFTPVHNDKIIDNAGFLNEASKVRIDTVFFYPRDIVVISTNDGVFRCDPGNIQLYKYFWDLTEDKETVKRQVRRSRFPRKQFKAYLQRSRKSKWKMSIAAAEWYMAIILGGTDE